MDAINQSAVGRKIMTAQQVAVAVGARPRAAKVIMCHGHFDLVHPGHVRHFLYAKNKADILVASLTADAHITKANYRPFVPEDLRALNLAALQMVDFVVVDDHATPLKNIAVIRPDYFAKGFEYSHGAHPGTAKEKQLVESYGGELLFTPGDVVYSSSRIIDQEPPRLATEKLLALLAAEGLRMADLRRALGAFDGLKVHVVGDTIVDSYTHCTLAGGMTKTPTMSVRYDKRVDFVGGAGIVAKHLRAAGARVWFSTVLGADPLAEFVLKDLEAADVRCWPIVDRGRPTTHKNAIVAQGYNLLKIDTLDNRPVKGRDLVDLTDQIKSVQPDIVVFSDFRHGIFNRDTIPTLIDAIPAGSFRVADSQVASRWGNILDFQNFDLITPNEREARFALGDQDSIVRPLGVELYRRAQCRTLMLKLGAHGLMTFRGNPRDDDELRTFYVLDSFAGPVVDAVGAGDAFLAYAALGMAASNGEDVVASALGSLAAAVECGHQGNIPVRSEAVAEQLMRLS